jgi:hypothetical protein
MARSPFPLSWPDGWVRSKWHKDSDFDKKRGFNKARDGALNELRLMSAKHVVITSNLPTNSRGLPHCVSAGQLTDPGIAVWWVDGKGNERVIACDCFYTAVENMHSIELTLAAIRGIKRWGATDMVERAFAGFAALPPGSTNGTYTAPPVEMRKTWREVFNMPLDTFGEFHLASDLLAVVKARYREAIKNDHPDIGGDPARAAELGAALAEAEEELGA